MNAVNESVESPIDYNKSQLKKLAISSDSLQMNCQYFSFDQNTQSSASHAATVSAFVSESLSIFGEGRSSQASASAQTQMNSQQQQQQHQQQSQVNPQDQQASSNHQQPTLPISSSSSLRQSLNNIVI